MNRSDLAAALAAGCTVVTPNKRLARRIAADYDAEQVARAIPAWPAARTVPWPAFLDNLWLDALAAGALAASHPPLTPAASAYLWERIVGEEAGLLAVRGAAQLAADAWSVFHAWRLPDESFHAWAQAGFADDAAMFAGWARAYRAALQAAGRIDAADLADVLAAAGERVPHWRGRSVVFAGFLDESRQRRRLIEALVAAGVVVTEAELSIRRETRTERVVAADRDAEIVLALEFARSRVAEDPAVRIGIVVPDFAQRRDEVLAVADDILCPQIALVPLADASRPYNATLGEPLANIPLVCAALDLIEWSATALPIGRAAAVLRCAYLPGGPVAWSGRAAVERVWRDAGRLQVTLAEAIELLLSGVDVEFGRRLRGATTPPGRRRSARDWAVVWQDWLVAAGWPGTQALSSHEWQAREAWVRLMAEFGGLDAVAPALSRADATTALRAMAMRTLFQAESSAAPIQILGVLEASGLDFDALWICGMSADSWPPQAAPNPLLPLAWQRSRGVPRAEASRALEFAQSLTRNFAASAARVIASHARTDDGQERAGSPLVADWTPVNVDELPVPAAYSRTVSKGAPPLEARLDAAAPPLPEDTVVRGGVGLIESQSNCPFQAFARHRLGAGEWPELPVALTSFERGNLLHKAMAAFWRPQDESRDLPPAGDPRLQARIEAAVELGCASLARSRWRTLPAVVAAGERRRLAVIIADWLEKVEQARPPFRVLEVEAGTTLALGGLKFRFVVDRVDAQEASAVIIDYKSGAAPAPVRWFASRPSGTQLGQYALALRQNEVLPEVRAVAYARMKGGAIEAVGLAADGALWPGLQTPADLRGTLLQDWSEVEEHWRRAYAGLATDFRSGRAEVAPRDAQACKHCAYPALCRIGSLEADVNEDEVDDAAG